MMKDGDFIRDLGSTSRELSMVQSTLVQWDGANALVLGSSLSHRHFRIEIWKQGQPTQLIVSCKGPEYYCGRLRWSDAHIRVAPITPDRVKTFAEFELQDERVGVRLTAGDVYLHEEVAHHWRSSKE